MKAAINLNDKIEKIGNLQGFKELSDDFDFWMEAICRLEFLSLIDEEQKNKLLNLYKISEHTSSSINKEFILMVNLIYKVLFKR